MKKSTKVKSKKVSKPSASPRKRLKKYEEGGKEVQGIKRKDTWDSFPGSNMPLAPKGDAMTMNLKSEAVPASKQLKKIELPAGSPNFSGQGAYAVTPAKMDEKKAKTVSTPKAKKIAGGFSSEAQKAAYIKNVKARMANGATIETLVKERVGTKEGLKALGISDAPKKDSKKSTPKSATESKIDNKKQPSNKKGELPKLITNSPLDNVKDAVNKSKTAKKSKPDYSEKTRVYTNKKGVKTSEKLTITDGKPTFTRVVKDKSGKKSTYVKSGNSMYLKDSKGNTTKLNNSKESTYDKKRRYGEIAKGRQKKELATGAASSVDDFWSSGIGGVAKAGIAGAAALGTRFLVKKGLQKATTNLANNIVKNTATGLLKNSAKATMKNQAAKNSFNQFINSAGAKAAAANFKKQGINLSKDAAKLTKDKLGKEFAKKIADKNSKKLLNAPINAVKKNTSTALKPDKIFKPIKKAIPRSTNAGKTIKVNGRTVSESSQKLLGNGQKALGNGQKMLGNTKGLPAPKKGLPAPKLPAKSNLKLSNVAKGRAAARANPANKIQKSIKTTNPGARSMARATKYDKLVKTGSKKITAAANRVKAKNYKPKPGDQLKLNLRKGGKK